MGKIKMKKIIAALAAVAFLILSCDDGGVDDNGGMSGEQEGLFAGDTPFIGTWEVDENIRTGYPYKLGDGMIRFIFTTDTDVERFDFQYGGEYKGYWLDSDYGKLTYAYDTDTLYIKGMFGDSPEMFILHYNEKTKTLASSPRGNSPYYYLLRKLSRSTLPPQPYNPAFR